MRPTDVCHPYDLRAPASRAFPASSPDFHRVDTPQSLRLCAVVTGGPNGSRRSRPLRRIVPHTTPTLFAFQCLPRAFCLTAFRTRAWAFSSHGAKTNRASDIPVASSRSPPPCTSLSCCASPRVVLLGVHTKCGRWGSCQDCLPHPPVTTSAFNNPGCLPSVGTLRRIRWPLQPRSRDPRVAFRPNREDRSMTLSRHRGSRPIHSRFCPVCSTCRRRFARCVHRRFHPPTLAPR
jgi:hypothetical protein